MEQKNDRNKLVYDHRIKHSLFVECFEGARFYDFRNIKSNEWNVNQIANCVKNNQIFLNIVLQNESEFRM